MLRQRCRLATIEESSHMWPQAGGSLAACGQAWRDHLAAAHQACDDDMGHARPSRGPRPRQPLSLLFPVMLSMVYMMSLLSLSAVVSPLRVAGTRSR
mmetsp:Transcript_93161/g.129375  ORF Transcript_93161/g.129375 Transcript_93161/m.129375 type:complete len:97 (-) Transcript_93161:238-528(-)